MDAGRLLTCLGTTVLGTWSSLFSALFLSRCLELCPHNLQAGSGVYLLSSWPSPVGPCALRFSKGTREAYISFNRIGGGDEVTSTVVINDRS